MTQALNEQFAIGDAIRVVEDNNGLAKVRLANRAGEAHIYLHGAQVTHYQPHNGERVLWLSEAAQFKPPAAIRGGVPVCWPWFGSPDTHQGLPAHGFARNSLWQLTDSARKDATTHAITLTLLDTEHTRTLWPHRFKLELTVTLAEALEISLTHTNTDDVQVTTAGALHSYFSVADIARTHIRGLEQTHYLDYVDQRKRKQQLGGVRIDQEVDRIYLATNADVFIDDGAANRCIRVAKKGSATTVVWNPWIEKTRALADCVDDAWQHMVCVESVNTLDDSRVLKPGEQHCLTQRISLQ